MQLVSEIIVIMFCANISTLKQNNNPRLHYCEGHSAGDTKQWITVLDCSLHFDALHKLTPSFLYKCKALQN